MVVFAVLAHREIVVHGIQRYVLKTWKYPVKDYLHINRTDCMVNTLVDLIMLVRTPFNVEAESYC